VKPPYNTVIPPIEPPSCDDRLVWDTYLSAFQYPVLVIADKIGLFQFLATTPATIDDLVNKYSINPIGMESLVGMLTAMGFLIQDKNHFYLTDTSRNFLLPESHYYWGWMLRLGWQLPRLSPAKMLENLQNKQQSVIKFTNIWSGNNEAEFEKDKAITAAMHSISFPAAMGMASRGDFNGVERLLDIGGGSGCFCIALAFYYQHLCCTVMERPNVCKIATHYIKKYGLTDRIDTKAIDMFQDEWPTDYDAIFFSNIFHDWSRDDCLGLSKRSFVALPSGGTIYIHEMLLNDSKDGPLAATAFSLNMVLVANGKQFSKQEAIELLQEAGFTEISITPTYGYYSLIKAKKP
jgi:hypothetical protein